jgi:hypothetical protein
VLKLRRHHCCLCLLMTLTACGSRVEEPGRHTAHDPPLPPLIWVHDVDSQDNAEALIGTRDPDRDSNREIVFHGYSGGGLESLFQSVAGLLKTADTRHSSVVHLTASGLAADELLGALGDANRTGSESVLWPEWLASITLHQGSSGVLPPEENFASGLKSDGIVRPRHRPGVVLLQQHCDDRQPGRLDNLARMLREAAYRTHLITISARVDTGSCEDGVAGATRQSLDRVQRLWSDFLAGFDISSQSLGADWIAREDAVELAPVYMNPSPASGGTPESTLEERLYADIRSYFHLGEHRTGTRTDSATQAWVARRMQTLGFTVAQQDWRVLQFFPDDVRVTNEVVSIDAWPLWTPAPTSSQEVSAPLTIVSTLDGATGAQGSIALVEALGSDRWRIPDFDRALIDAGAVGAIYVTGRGNTGYFYAENAPTENVNRVRELPGVLIGSRGRDQLLSHVGPGEHVALRIQGQLSPAESSNVIATLDRGGSWIIVSTPTSGWFRAGGERGAGVALWLALGEWASSQDFPVSFMFVANSGHELDYYGAEHLFDSGVLPAPDQTLAWLHLGASIGTPGWHADGLLLRRDPRISGGNLFASESFRTGLERSFAAVEALSPKPHRAVGELGRVVTKGYPAFGLVGGGNVWSHSHPDTPESVSVESLAEVGRALSHALASIVSHHETTSAR